MWSSRSILLRQRPRRSLAAVAHRVLQRNGRRTLVAASTATSDEGSSRRYARTAAATAMVSAVALSSLREEEHEARCEAMGTASPFSLSGPSTSVSSGPSLSSKVASAEPSKAARRQTYRQGPRNVMLHRMRSVRARNMGEKYKVDWNTVLGEGAYGSVHPARLAATGEKVALKKISKRYTNSSSFQTETDALLRIFDNGGHPNISGLRDMYEDATHFYMILDLVSGGEMFEHLINYGAYSEADAARLMHEIASALAFLHGVGVAHADLKPENLLLCSKKRHDGTIKMIDFGCAVVEDPDGFEEEFVNSQMLVDGPPLTSTTKKRSDKKKNASSTGTTAYWPPERFEKGREANSAMDMWSVGVILYIMLTGIHPFDESGCSTDAEIEKRILADPSPPLGPEYTGHLTESAVDLIKKLMHKDPDQRLTAYEMLQHPWVRGETATTEVMVDSDKKLSRFKDLRRSLEAGIFAVLVSHGHQDVTLSEKKIKTRDSEKRRGEASTHLMKRAFEVFDAEGKGFVTSDDLRSVVLDRTGAELSSSDTQEFLATTQGDSPAEELSLSDFSKLFSGLKHQHFPRGHVIFNAGDKGDAMYFLCSGKVEVKTRKGQLVSLLRSGDFFGEGSLLNDDNRRFTTIKCATPVDVMMIKKADFDRYVSSSETAKNELRLKWRARNLDYAKNLIRLQTNVETREYKKGDVIYREGDVGTSMYRVCDGDGGELAVSHGDNVVHNYTEGESFGESSLLFARPRSSTVTCVSDVCKVHKMRGKDFLALVDASPEMATALRDMCRKRLFKKAVKAYSLERKKGLSKDDIEAAFYAADLDKSGYLNLEEVKALMHRMDPEFPVEEINALLKHIDVDEDGLISIEEFKRLFRQFEDESEK